MALIRRKVHEPTLQKMGETVRDMDKKIEPMYNKKTLLLIKQETDVKM